MSECWRLGCSRESTHSVMAPGGPPVTTCEPCAVDLVENGKWQSYEPLSKENVASQE